MADVRINALATTATTSASDDYLAIDGSANGTRKLSAYSPTFGGNLTVSGATTLASGQYVKLGSAFFAVNDSGAATNYLFSGGAGGTVFRNGNDTATLATLSNAGNLTVSGTGTSTFAGPLTVDRSSSGTVGILKASSVGAGGQVNLFLGKSDSTYNCSTLIYKHVGDGSSSNYVGLGFYGNDNLLNVVANGNVLLGTTTDSGNGKLQLATHTTSAGGIGFGTATSLYNGGGTSGFLYADGTSPLFGLAVAGSRKGYFYWDGSSVVLEADTGDVKIGSPASKSVILRTNAGTTALTLDSSQNATFAGTGTQTFNGLIHAKAGVSLTGGQILNLNLLGTAQILSSAANTINLNATTVAMGGALKLGNAYTAGAPTATGYVTIQDSAGNTYKVLVGT